MSELELSPDLVFFDPDRANSFIADAQKRSGVELPYEQEDAQLVVEALLGEYLESSQAETERGQAYAEYAIELLQQPQNNRSVNSRRLLARRVLTAHYRRRWDQEGKEQHEIEALTSKFMYESELNQQANQLQQNALGYIHAGIASRLEEQAVPEAMKHSEASIEGLRTEFHNTVVDLLDAGHVNRTEAAALLLIMENVPYSTDPSTKLYQRKAVGQMRARIAGMIDKEDPEHVLLEGIARVNEDETASFSGAVLKHSERTKLGYVPASIDYMRRTTDLIATLLTRGE